MLRAFATRALALMGFIASSSVVPRALLAQTATFDLSGVQLYWRTVDALAAGTLTVDSAIAQLGVHPGYAQIQRNGGRLRVIAWCLRRRYPRTAADTTTPPANRVEIHQRACAHLRDAELLRDSLTRFGAVLTSATGRERISRAHSDARALVPARVATVQPAVYVLLFEDNGFGGDALALDLLRLMRSDANTTVRYLAHELHHSMVVRLPEDIDEARADSTQRAWLTWMSRVHLEGVASLLDKGAAMRSDALTPAVPRADWSASLSAHAARVAQVPAWLTRIANAGTPAARDSALQASIDDGGHATGQYMATAIMRALGRDSLVAVVGDRFAFVEAYARAARQAGAVPLGDARREEIRALRLAAGTRR